MSLPKFEYRLERLLELRTAERDAAQAALTREERELREQKAVLEQLEVDFNLAEKRRQSSRLALLHSDKGGHLRGADINRRRDYLQVLDSEIEALNEALLSQRAKIKQCRQQVDQARRHLGRCTRRLEVLSKHRAKLQSRFQKELSKREQSEMDEAGNIIFERKRRSRFL